MSFDARAYIRHIDACTNAELPGRRTRLRLGGALVGWVLPAYAPRTRLADAAAFAAYVGDLERAGAFASRRELFDVRDEATGSVVATADRGALPVLGIVARGVHVNGLVRKGTGLHLWIARRAADTRLDPGKLDHLTAGGIPSGYDPMTTVVKEASEEASVPEALARTAREVATLAYAMERTEGLRRDVLHCYDLDLPEAFEPRPHDNEVTSFALWPVSRVIEAVAETDAFKFNVNLVLIDLFLRHGLIDPMTGSGASVARAMERIRRDDTKPPARHPAPPAPVR